MNTVRHIRIPRGCRIEVTDRGSFTAIRALDGQRVQFEREEDGELLTLSKHEIALMLLKHQLVFTTVLRPASGKLSATQSPAAVPAAEAEEAGRRWRLAKDYVDSGTPRSIAGAKAWLAALATENRPSPAPSPRNLLRWVKLLADSHTPGSIALVSRHCDKGTRGSRLDPRVEFLLDEAIGEVYLTEARYPVAEVYAALSAKLLQKADEGIHLAMPSASTIERRVAAVDGYQKKLARRGGEAAKAAYKPAGRYPEPERPMQIVQIDHTKADQFVWDNVKLRRVVARPWITSAIDVYSRSVVALYVSFQSAQRRIGHGLPVAHDASQGADPGGLRPPGARMALHGHPRAGDHRQRQGVPLRIDGARP